MDLKKIEIGTIIVDITVTVIVIMLHLWEIIVFPYEGKLSFRIFLIVFLVISISIHLNYILQSNPDYAKFIKYLLFMIVPVFVGSVILIQVTQGRLSDTAFETACNFFLSAIVAIALIFGCEKHWEDIQAAIQHFIESIL